MQNDKTYFEILSSIKTEKEKDLLTMQVGALIDSLYKTNGAEFEKEFEGMDYNIASIIKQVPKEALSDFLTSLKEKIIALPTIRITLSFKPTMSFLNKLHQNWPQEGVLEIGSDPSILGGIIFESQGKHVDLSIKRKMDQVLEGMING